MMHDSKLDGKLTVIYVDSWRKEIFRDDPYPFRKMWRIGQTFVKDSVNYEVVNKAWAPAIDSTSMVIEIKEVSWMHEL